MKLSVVFLLFLTVAVLNIASGKDFENPLWHEEFVEIAIRAQVLQGDRRQTFMAKVEMVFDGVKAMCEQHGKKSIDAVIKCVPDWIAYKFDAATTERRFEQNADLCWKEIEPMFSECGLKNYGTVSRMVRDDIYKAAIKQDKDEQTRLHEIINTYAKFTVPNDKTTENYKCFRGALMVDFKPDTTLTPDEVTRMAGRLVNLVRKLDKNSEGQRVLY